MSGFKKRLVILELANNHGGDVELGLGIIRAFQYFINDYKHLFDFAIKFQFRNLDTFIHKDYKHNTEHNYVKRFLSSKLTDDEFLILKTEAEKLGFLTICTAFDEESVDKIVSMKFDYIKIASCSFNDWPLLNKIADSTNLPIIASCAGADLDTIDKVVSFFVHRNKSLSLMHCIGEYPTPPEHFQLNQIDLLRTRYPNISIGFSSHESPEGILGIQLAVAKGAMIFERHVTIHCNICPKNKYSMYPHEFKEWIKAAADAIDACGGLVVFGRYHPKDKEIKDLTQFKRGVYLKYNVPQGHAITRNDVYYAFPNIEGQVLANDMSKYISLVTNKPLTKDSPVLNTDVTMVNSREQIWKYVQHIKLMLEDSKITFPGKATLELSHHYGIDKFETTGITMITVVNEEYCKKLIIILPGQENPFHYHKLKKETFFVLYGNINIYTKPNILLDDTYAPITLSKGEMFTIFPNQIHKFNSKQGCIIEELSTKHYPNDSYYTDDTIQQNKNRKTIINYWL